MTDQDLLARAEVASAEGDFGEAIRLLEAALSSGSLDQHDGIRALSSLSAACRLDSKWPAAEQHAREAVRRATESNQPRLLARANLELGTLMLSIFEEEISSAGPDPWSEALAAIEAATEVYERLGTIDFYSCLLTLARVVEAAGDYDSATGIYARVTRELGDNRWAENHTLAQHADHLRGRAFLELARGEADRNRQDLASEYYESAVELFEASGAPNVGAIVEMIAEERRGLVAQ